jgi:hypothetical protein
MLVPIGQDYTTDDVVRERPPQARFEVSASQAFVRVARLPILAKTAIRVIVASTDSFRR